MHAQKWHTGTPKQEKRDQCIRLNALALRNRVVQGQERRPYRTNHDARGICAIHVLDGVPENGKNGARDDGNVGAPETPGCAGEDRKGDVVDYADCTVECDDKRYHEEGEGDDTEGFAPCQALVLLVLWLRKWGGEMDRWR
jgi:hypothetical protein